MSWILTRTGVKFDLANPHPDMINTFDIAHSLSMQCRFNGHTKAFYSVAQHSCLVADLVPPEHQLAALLHDATEAYVGDLVRPLKEGMRDFAERMGVCELYSEVEAKVWVAICMHFDLDVHLPDSVKQADMIALALERRDLMPDHPEQWSCLEGITPPDIDVTPWSPEQAAQEFHTRLLQLLATTHRAKRQAEAL